MVMAPPSRPVVVGVNDTSKVQLPRDARDRPQRLFEMAKSPLGRMLAILSGPVPVLERVTVCTALVVPTIWALKVRLGVDSPAKGRTPVVERLTKF